jgi:phage-related tail protein
MKADHVQNYVDNQIQQRADDAIRPLMNAIASEVETQREIGETLKQAQKDAEQGMKESNERLAKLQAELHQAKADVFDFANKLTSSTEGAATRK